MRINIISILPFADKKYSKKNSFPCHFDSYQMQASICPSIDIAVILPQVIALQTSASAKNKSKI